MVVNKENFQTNRRKYKPKTVEHIHCIMKPTTKGCMVASITSNFREQIINKNKISRAKTLTQYKSNRRLQAFLSQSDDQCIDIEAVGFEASQLAAHGKHPAFRSRSVSKL
jgi:hypothetical protein